MVDWDSHYPVLYIRNAYFRTRYLYGTPSGTRTLDTLIKSQVLYQLS